MTPYTYLLEAINAGAHLRSEWVTRAFCVSNIAKEITEDSYDYQLLDIDGVYGFVKGNEVVMIPDTDVTKPLLHKNAPIELKKGWLPNVERDVITLVGNVIANAIMFIYPFEDKFPFLLGKFNLGKIEKQIIQNLYDDVAEGETEDADKFYVRELVKFIDATVSLTGFNSLFVPGATEYTLGPAPKALERMKELLEEHKDHLDDPVVIANIQKEIEVLDREYIASDPDAGFYFKDKSFKVVRMKMYYMYGIEKNFANDGTYTFIEKPLNDGWDLSKLPEMSNTARDGSFKRGAETALGGEKVKIAFRAMTGVIVNVEDCGSMIGEPVHLYSDKYLNFVGNTFIVNGKLVKIDESNVESFKDQTVLVRSPTTCNVVDGNLCAVCVGDFIRSRENTLGARVAEIPSTMMGLSMGAMHGKALKTVLIDITRALT